MAVGLREREFTTDEACAITGATYRQAWYWWRQFVGETAGSGFRRRWPAGLVLALGGTVLLAGASTATRVAVADALRDAAAGERVRDFLVVECGGAWMTDDADEIVALLRSEAISVVCLGPLKERLGLR